PTAHDPIETFKIEAENQRHAADRESSGMRSPPLCEASQDASLAELADAPPAPYQTEALQAKDESNQHLADAERRESNGTQIQPLSEAAQTAAPTPSTVAPPAPG